MQWQKFQFPTGWNSTPCEKRPPRWQAVSIPNGMEFYFRSSKNRRLADSFNSQRDGILRTTFCDSTWNFVSFNSQRDGILLFWPKVFIQNSFVSIPNGMEFYENDTYTFSNSSKSFNSQRDGILHFLSRDMSAIYEFQFPTGWNSTPEWEKRDDHFYCFNSQRDGILRRFSKLILMKSSVSIPNGMEFYPTCPVIKTSLSCFNSQRDGILPSRYRRRLKAARWVSIPNGMEFYAEE